MGSQKSDRIQNSESSSESTDDSAQSSLQGSSSQQSSCRRTVTHSLAERELAADIQTLAAVGTDTRYEALRCIAETENGVCVCELEPALGVSQGAVSQALSRLYTAGLVTRRKEGRWRYYTATERAERLLSVLNKTRSTGDERRNTRAEE